MLPHIDLYCPNTQFDRTRVKRQHGNKSKGNFEDIARLHSVFISFVPRGKVLLIIVEATIPRALHALASFSRDLIRIPPRWSVPESRHAHRDSLSLHSAGSGQGEVKIKKSTKRKCPKGKKEKLIISSVPNRSNDVLEFRFAS